MKNIYLFLACSFIILHTYAQPTFTQANWPPNGTVLTMYVVDSAAISPGNSGANQTWDFSMYLSTSAPFTSEIVAPSGTPFYAQFPTANSASHSPSTLGNDGYGYMNVTSSYADLIGLVLMTPDYDIVYNYSDPRRTISFPYTYNSTLTDNFTATASYDIGAGVIVEVYRHGSVSLMADGYGTLITPAGTFNNALRTISSEVTTDSIVYAGLPIPPSISTTRITSYSWQTSQAFQSVYSISFDTTIVDASVFYGMSTIYSSSSVGIETPDIKKLSLTVFPVPASQTISVSATELVQGTLTYTITDLRGRVVLKGEKSLSSDKLEIEISGLARGLYHVNVLQGNNLFKAPFIKN